VFDGRPVRQALDRAAQGFVEILKAGGYY